MNVKDLKENDQVVFMVYSDLFEKKIYETGTVISVNQDAHAVAVCWLEGYRNRNDLGYRNRNDLVDYEDMVAKYDKDGEYMKFGNISGPSVLLEPDERCIDIER